MLMSCSESGGSATYMERDLLLCQPGFGCRSICERVAHFLFFSHFLWFFGSVFARLAFCGTRACRRRTSCLSLLSIFALLLCIFTALLCATLVSSLLLSLSGSSLGLALSLGRCCGPSRADALVKPADEHIPAESVGMRLDVRHLGSERSKLLSVIL